MSIPRIRTLLLVALVGAFFFWLRYGEQILSGQRQDQAAATIAQYHAEVASKNPESANWIEKQKDQYGERAVAASIRSQRGALVSFEAQQQLISNSARLISLYERDLLRDEAILWSHGTALRVADGDAALSEALLSRLEAAQAQPDLWTLVRDDPVALSSDLLFESKSYRDFYAAHQSWLEALMTSLVQTVDVAAAADTTGPAATTAAAPPAISLDAVLEVAVASQPYLKQAIPDPQRNPSEAAVIFLTFLEHGDLLVALGNQDVPPTEAVEVLLLNEDYLRPAGQAGDDRGAVDATAAKLARIHRDKPVIWDQARREPLLLQFDELVPLYSQRLIKTFPEHGIPALIVTQYADAPLAAATAIDRYGELAIAVLVHYADSPRFVQLLGEREPGYQVVMVAAMQSDEGLEKLAGDPRYLTKLIDADGNPRQADWWQAVPVAGGIANVARNYATDRPSDWSELGWATWDVVDAVLIVGSLGTSKLLTEAGKQGLKATARRAGRSAALRAGGRTPVVASAAGRAPTALQRLSQLAARGATGESAGTAARVAAAAATVQIGGRVVALAARPLLAVSGKAYQASRVVFTAASSTPPLVRLWVTRGLLGISLLARTPAMVRSVATGAANFTAAVVDQLGKQVDAIKEFIGMPAVAEGLLGRGLHRAGYFGVLMLIGFLAWWTLFSQARLRPRYR